MSEKKQRSELLVVAIYFAIVALFWTVVPAPAPLTEVGIKVLGLFFAFIVGFTMTEAPWVHLVSFVLAMFTGVFANIAAIMPSTWGGDTFLFMLLLFVVIEYLRFSGFSKFVSAYLLSRPFLVGHPYRIIGMLMLVAWILAIFVGIFAGLLLTWGFIYQICGIVGYKKHSPQACAMVFGVTLVGALSLSTIPFLHNALVIIAAFTGSTGLEVNLIHYLLYSVPENLMIIALYLLMLKVLWRIDVSAMENMTIDFIPKEDLVMTKEVKMSLAFLIALVVLVFAPNVLPAGNPVQAALKAIGNSGITMILLVIWSLIKMDDKEIFPIGDLAKNGIPWNMVWCSLAIFTFIALLGNPETGISAFVASFLGPIFVGKPAALFIILSMVITIVLTNFMANMVVAVVMFAACLPIGATLGIDPMQLGFLYTICSSMAFLLPAASPAGMLVFMNKEWMTTGEIYKYAIPTIIMMGVVAYVWNIILFMFI
ncbi:MAG: hypothetical protein IKU46_02975 [Peptococcaceae bacterium]|nr:hypothetical protein [Peptococcaceae bacterium]